ncbi:MAG: hypothetical protein IJM83_08460 [Firmicutes bacterium]|nr:hypothetical protein [Bacillota bacterium]
MPTRTTDTQTYQNQSIQCAKFVSDEPFVWKAVKVVQAATDYWFQFVIKASADATIMIQVGDMVKSQAVTTDWTKYVIDFPSVTNDVDSLYIGFPAGTYWVYNVQLEPAQTPSAWRPAPEDGEDYADKAAQDAVDSQTQLDVFNKLTNNGTAQGVYMVDGQIYINGEYIAANTVNANVLSGGTIKGVTIDIGNGVFVVDENGEVTAANLHMTGGSLNLETDTETYDFIRLTYGAWKSVFSTQSVSFQYANSVTGRTYQVTYSPISIEGFIDTGTSKHGFQISMPSGTTSSSTGGISLFDGAGTERVRLTNNGLNFYNASGTLTKTYSAT